MESTKLDAPKGIEARVGWAPGSQASDRVRQLTKEILADRLQIDETFIDVSRQAPAQFGHHPQPIAVVDGLPVPLSVRTASFRTASVVAVAEPDLLVGLDIRDHRPDEAALHEIRGHSHLWDDDSLWNKATPEQLALHWSRVQAVRQADPRGISVRPEQVRLDPPFAKAWTPDRKGDYRLVDLSRNGFVITLAYGEPATE
ncbi:hypothetical protein ET475_10535 [Microbacterium protaetiae]|uniref:Uncharacterized protein n=1 Tax=Microbacterium protaetiae TaxID=2509458 RepID=A0A4P6EGT1_9MICO|nr:hypothetical protein [Microbacterium protaetiae]QAY60379.1 hypothetical protein ET475_10535 [Microbacterium protaetiae]